MTAKGAYNPKRDAARMRAYSKTPNGKAAMRRVAEKIRREKPHLLLLWNARASTKKRGMGRHGSATEPRLECTITEADIRVPTTCPVLGIPLFFTPGKRTDNTPSLDRVDSTRGYVPGNVLVVSWRANKLKQDASVGEMEKLWRFYANLAG